MISTIIPRCFQTVVKILFPLTLITLSFETSISPLGNPRIFDCRPSPGENLNRKWQVFLGEGRKEGFISYYKYRVLKVQSSRSRADGSEEEVYKLLINFKAWSMRRKLRSPILPRIKKLTIKSSTWVRHLNTILARRGRRIWINQFSKVQMPWGIPGKMLKLPLDRRITLAAFWRRPSSIRTNPKLWRNERLWGWNEKHWKKVFEAKANEISRSDEHFVKPGVAIFGTGKVGGEGV